MLIDMPLEELKVYMGTNPRPLDIDKFWDRELDKLDDLDLDIELIPAKFQAPGAECFHLYFTGTGGARVHAKYLRPKNSKGPHPAVLLFHGYSGNSGEWWDKLSYVAAGYSVAALDVRGQAGLSEDVGGVKGNTLNGHIIRGLDEGPHKLLFKDIYLDTALLARIVMDMPEVDADRLGALGGSQGGGLTLACASLEPRVKRVAPVYPFLSDYQRVWEMDLAIAAYQELKNYFRSFDPTHSRAKEIFTTLGYIDIQHITKRIEAEVMMGVGLMDTICPPSSQYAAFNKIKSKKKTVLYPDFAHENLPGFNDMTYEFMMGL